MTIEIERQKFPIPKDVGPPSHYPFGDLKVGDSFFVPATAGHRALVSARVRSAASVTRWRHIEGMQFKTRSVDGGVRVWRIK